MSSNPGTGSAPQALARRGGVKDERLRRLHCYGSEPPAVRRQHPRQAYHVVAAGRLDDDPALARHARINLHLAGVDDPSAEGES
jgi:hypothetical protein